MGKTEGLISGTPLVSRGIKDNASGQPLTESIPTIGKMAAQAEAFKKGNETAALAAKQINFHLMGYYPITPSTEIAEGLDAMLANGEHGIRMVPAEGEHSAAGICYGASTGGGRVLNATSSQGLLYSMEQLPVQSGTRFPMVLNLVTRAVSGPLDIRGDHSDLMLALGLGWIVLTARDPQAVYDYNIMAVRIGEHPEVRLPVIVAYDGFFTSHQKRLISYFEDDSVVQNFVGPFQAHVTTLDPAHPVTVGPYMNDPDLINNKYQLKMAMEAAERVIPEVFREYAGLSGRSYPLVDAYRMEDAEVALVLVNSAAETAKDAVDALRLAGQRVGLLSPNVLRPFPGEEFRRLLRGVKAVVVGERADNYGAGGGTLALEIKAALKDDPGNRTVCLSRIYGLGGKDFYLEDGQELLRQGLEAAGGNSPVLYDYLGANPGDPDLVMEAATATVETFAQAGRGLIKAEEKDGRVEIKVPTPRQMSAVPERIAPGHGACPGCGIFPSVNQFLKGIEGNVVLLFQTGCGMVVTTGYPYTSFRSTYIHNLFQSGGATLSGVVEMYRERIKRGEIPAEEITFIMVSGDGGMDIGMGSALGAALRGHPMIILEYDNMGYMNTGDQLSYSTPIGRATSTSHVGPCATGKKFQHKDMPQIMAATNIPYVFTSVEGFGTDLIKKAAKAQVYARHGGFSYGQVLSACPLSWRSDEKMGGEVVRTAVESCFFPLYEVERGKTNITYDPEARGKRVPVSDWLKQMGATRHMTRPENAGVLREFEAEIERRWQRLKAKHEHPML